MTFSLRLAHEADVPGLAELHVQTFNETHRGGRPTGPPYELRERQWRERFALQGDSSEFEGELSVDEGVTSMLLFGEATNPSNGFYESFGAERLYSEKGEFHGSYDWRDLRVLVEQCRG